MQINGRVREREKKKRKMNDIEFKYVRSKIDIIKVKVIKH